MSGLLQVLGVALAMIAVGTFLMSAFLLGGEARGWRDAHPVGRLVLHGLAIFWLVAALVAMSSPRAVITPLTLFAALVFAGLGVAVLAWVVRHRPARSTARFREPRT